MPEIRPIFKMMIFWQFIGRTKGTFLSYHHFMAILLRLLKGILVMLWNQIVFSSTTSIWEALINATNNCHIMQFQRSRPSGGIFSITWVMCNKFNVLVFWEKSRVCKKGKKPQRCPEMLIHELVQPVFHKQNYNESPANMAYLYQPKKRSRIMGKMTFALEAGIMQQRSTLEGSTVCVDTKWTKRQGKKQQAHTKLLWKISKIYLWGLFSSFHTQVDYKNVFQNIS